MLSSTPANRRALVLPHDEKLASAAGAWAGELLRTTLVQAGREVQKLSTSDQWGLLTLN